MSSRDSSPLSSLPSSPLSEATSLSPPPEFPPLHLPPSPPASQDSSDAESPCPDGMDSTIRVSNKDGPPPAKKRRISERKERTTEYLDIRHDPVEEDEQEHLDRLIKTLHKRRKIVVVAGAGISVSAGIPDFRSSTGLFTSLRSEHNLKGSGKSLFDASVYKDDDSTSSFHDMVRSMSKLTKNAQPSNFHHLLATLADEGRLLRLYTQNVDGIDVGLEPLATTVPLRKVEGKWPRTIQLHGGLAKMVCSKCKALSDFDADLFDGPVPPTCQECVEMDRVRTDVAGKRSHGIGRLRPRMVLYNEHNPDEEAIGSVVSEDLRKRPDAIIVVGTSLKIPGVRRIVREMCATVRDRKDGVAVWINNDPEPTGVEFKDCWDIVVQGTCDEVARYAAMRRWYEQGEITEEEWEEAVKTKAEVVINKAYKPLSKIAPFRLSSGSPDYSPLPRKTISEIGDLTTDSEDMPFGAPPTPSKSARNSPAKKTVTAFDAMKSKKGTETKKTAANKKSTGKAAATIKAKAAPKHAKKPAKKAEPKVTIRLNQTMTQSKSSVAATGKGDKTPTKAGTKRRGSEIDPEQVMGDVPQKNVRRNSPPKIRLPSKLREEFSPELGDPVPKMAALTRETGHQDSRMSISSILSD
ncbi:DHS-like NAD/FAD-binding domain-containing protein [Elsinoe ampelina]|uniref:DHS-like NAD/FAD-binding domain-containing protein n=1 Tax=Elsinoe ampelina TaxID=302913 RepID=A0A6A6GBP9_9PEZI|nr:DHS-like NAD/FAD-binding domain-containing protein [Elsinoe ampelina]